MIIDYSLPDAAARHLLAELAGDRVELRRSTARHACRQPTPMIGPASVRNIAKLYDAATGTTVRTILDVPVQVRTFDASGRTASTRASRDASQSLSPSPMRIR